MALHDETGWDWDHESNVDGFHVTVRLQTVKGTDRENKIK